MSDVYPRHQALVPQRLAMRRIFPWTQTVGKILYFARRDPSPLDHLFICSDYGGYHASSKFRTYAYFALAALPKSWQRRRALQGAPLTEPLRRLSYKRLNNSHSYDLARCILSEGDRIPGILTVFAIERSLRLNPITVSDMSKWSDTMGLSAKWKPKSFEDAYLKAHLFALIAGQWAKPNSDLTWITDEDESVANEARLDDVQRIAAQLSLIYLQSPMRVFAMNTSAIDGPEREYEDLLSIPDLAAGMIADLLTDLVRRPNWRDFQSRKSIDPDQLKSKTSPLVEWFWEDRSLLKKVCIVFDRVGSQLRVFKLDSF